MKPGTVYLKVKIKSLTEEARIIKREESKALCGARTRKQREMPFSEGYTTYEGLRSHRIDYVRPEARATVLAYNFLRGRTYQQTENNSHLYEMPTYGRKVMWERVQKMVSKYGDKTQAQQEALAAWIKSSETWLLAA